MAKKADKKNKAPIRKAYHYMKAVPGAALKLLALALAVVILGRYCPGGVFLAALLFGVANGAQIRLQALGIELPMQLLAMLPYVITLIALLITSGRSREPESLAKPYIRGGR